VASQWVKYLIQPNSSPAADYLAASPSKPNAPRSWLVPFESQAAAQLGTLTRNRGSCASSSLLAPEILRAAARQLFDAGDKQSARKLIEFVSPAKSKIISCAPTLGSREILALAYATRPGALELLRRLPPLWQSLQISIPPRRSSKDGHNARPSNSSISS